MSLAVSLRVRCEKCEGLDEVERKMGWSQESGRGIDGLEGGVFRGKARPQDPRGRPGEQHRAEGPPSLFAQSGGFFSPKGRGVTQRPALHIWLYC